jgi:hypothetical protein
MDEGAAGWRGGGLTDALSNKRVHRSRRSEFLIVPSMPLGGPVTHSVGPLRRTSVRVAITDH